MYRDLVKGEVLQDGDQAWAWIDPDCEELGWVIVGSDGVGEVFDPEEMVRIRRPVQVEGK